MKIMKVLIIPFASFGLLFYPVSTNAQTVKSNQSESPQYQNNEESSVHATQTSAVESQTFYDWFPDDHLAEAVAQKLYMEPTDQVSSEDLSQIKVLQCYNAGITDMSGIEYLTGLTFLDCTANQLTELDVSQNVNLEKLNCSKNPLTVLHTGINLKSLDCHSCQFTELNLNQSPNLTELYCYQNQLKELNLSQFVNLEVVDCFNNQLTELNVTNSPHLTELNCESNQLTELDVSQNPKLEYLTVNGNQLTQLDVSENPNLLNLFCIKNQITQLDLTHNPALTIVYAGENQFTNVDVTQCHELRQFECDANQLSSLDVSENPNLTYLYCVDNQLATLDVSQNPELSELYCSSNQLTSIDFGQNPGKYYALYLDDNQLQDFSTMPIDQDTDFVGTGQNIQLAPEETTSNTLTIPVSEELKDENGNPMNITVTDGGIYDPDTNTITWENLDASGTVQYHFASESTRCSGTVTVPYQESKPMTLQVDEEITYDKAAVISEQQFLQDIHATTEDGNELSSDFAEVVDFSMPGDYEVTVTASNDKNSIEKKVTVHIQTVDTSNDVPIPPVAPDQPSGDGSADGGNHSKDKAEGKGSDTSDLTINETEVSNVNSSSLPKTGDQASLGWTVLGSITITLAGVYLLRRKK